jgi:glycosyltransferase involved in cell wall biosynthesis
VHGEVAFKGLASTGIFLTAVRYRISQAILNLPCMSFFHNPPWINKQLLTCSSFDEIPNAIFSAINERLYQLRSDQPLVSVVIPAWNEEVNIVRTLDSLSKSKTTFPFEIIVINNNSADRTQEALDRISEVKSVFQSIKGCGPARQLGQECARGKYILMADADCFYPSDWIEKMVRELSKKNVALVYGRYSFLGTVKMPRWKLAIYQVLHDGIAEIRHVKRPCVNAVGMSMGYVKELGLKAGFVKTPVRGEDGRLCFLLREMGRINQVRDRSIRVWTLPRTLAKDGSLWFAMTTRIAKELSRLYQYFYPQQAHNVHATGEYKPKSVEYLNRLKSLIKKDTSVNREAAKKII